MASVANRQAEYDQTILIDSLFQSYKTTKDAEFTQYITRKQEDHDDQSIIVNAEQLMEQAMMVPSGTNTNTLLTKHAAFHPL